MSDAKHTPDIDGDAGAVFDCLKYHASAGGEYEYRGTLAIEAFTRICTEIATLRAAAEKAKEALDAVEFVYGEDHPDGESVSFDAVRSAIAALEDVLK